MKAAVGAHIRSLQPEDAPQVVRIDRLSNPLPWSQMAYQREPMRPYSHAWVMEMPPSNAGAPALVAFLISWHIVDEAHIANLAVHPHYRRQGLARTLLRHALLTAQQSGMRSALLEVRAGNVPALALYRAFGFELVGRRKGYYRDNGEDALLMTLPDLEKWRPDVP